MSDNSDPRFWCARRVCEAISKKEISAEEYTKLLLSECAARSELNAFIALNGDHALSRARERDKSSRRGPLHGLPVGIKDAIGTADLPTSAGTPALRAHRPPANAEAIQPLMDAGSFVFGKLNLHELSFGITSNNATTGAVRNPYDTTRIPGGSSGGAGAAVAAGLVPAAMGTDTGGSVRIPAGLCGVVGFRPTTGRYPQRGIVPISPTRDTAGPLCRTVDDAAMLDAVVAGEEDRLEPLHPSSLRLGVPNRYFLDNLHPDTAGVYEDRLSELAGAGWTLVKVDIEGLEPPTESCGFPIAVYETKGALQQYLSDFAPHGPTLESLIAGIGSPDVRGLLEGLLAPEFEDMADAYRDAIENRRPRLQRILAGCFSGHRLDAVIFPTTVLPAAPIGDDETTELNGERLPTFPAFIHNTDPGSIAGIPGISVPAGLTPAGLPVGLGLDGPSGSDRHLLSVAALLERQMPATPRPRHSEETNN